MKPLRPHGIEPGTTDGHVLTTRNGRSTWRAPAISTPPATASPGDVPVINDDGTTSWAPPPVPTPPADTPAGSVPTTDETGAVTWGPATATSSAYREVLMASGVTPPEPLVSSDGFDWLYGEASS